MFHFDCKFKPEKCVSYAVAASDDSQLSLTHCVAGATSCGNSRITLQQCQINHALGVDHQGQLRADQLVMSNRIENLNLIYAAQQASIAIDALILPQGHNPAHVIDSRLEVGQTNLDAATTLTIRVEGPNTLSVPGAKLSEPRAAKPQPAQSPALAELDAMIGLSKLKAQVHDFIRNARLEKRRAALVGHPEPQNFNSLFLGNPGTGKTAVAKMMGKVLHENGVLPSDKLVVVTRDGLVSNKIGDTAIKTKKVLESALGGVLLVDEAYTLAEGGASDFGQEAVDTILPFIYDHRGEFMVIFAGYTDKMQNVLAMNPGMDSRFPHRFEFADYSPDEIAQIGLMKLQARYHVDAAHYTQAIKRAYKAEKPTGNARWAEESFNKQLISQFNKQLPPDAPDAALLNIPNSAIDALVGADLADRDKQTDALQAQLNNLIGLRQVKKEANELIASIRVIQAHPELAVDSSPTYHMIFAGAPGTGKSVVAEIFAKLFHNLGILPKDTVMRVTRGDLVGEYIGHTEKKTAKVLRDAEGGVLIVDEAYELMGDGANDFGKVAMEVLMDALETKRDRLVVIFAGYGAEMAKLQDVNPGMASRINKTLVFEDYSPAEVADIVLLRMPKPYRFNKQLLRTIVIHRYRAATKRNNGRWARTFVDSLLMQHRLWIDRHDKAHPDQKIDATVISDHELETLYR